MIYLLLYITAVSVFSFLQFGYDKRKAERGEWRVPEARLLMVAFLGGSFGALFGMRVFHHKTRDLKFRVFVPVFCALHSLILLKFYGILEVPELAVI